MNCDQRLKLQEMITENNVKDNTLLIRIFKHSQKIRDDVTTMAEVFRDYQRLSDDKMLQICKSRCAFLYANYTDLFFKIYKKQLNMELLDKVLSSLKKIEDSEMDQHEASFEVGTLLKKMYVDSALRRQKDQEKKDKDNEQHKKKKISKADLKRESMHWKDFKKKYLE